MPLYVDVVSKALNREVAPFLRNLMEPALVNAHGSNWYYSYGQDILRYYKSYGEIVKRIEEGMKPLETMDITALCFLLNPYHTESEEQKAVNFPGAMSVLTVYYQWDQWQVRRIDRIRQIRNLVSHDRFEEHFEKSETNQLNGVQEKQWLTELEEIIKKISPSFSLAEYYIELSEDIEKEKKKDGQNTFVSSFMREGEMTRQSYQKIHCFEFTKAPLQSPLTGVAPWALSDADLQTLPWPSTISAQQEEPKTAVDTSKSNDPAQKINDAVNKMNKLLYDDTKQKFDAAFNRLDKGVSKLLSNDTKQVADEALNKLNKGINTLRNADTKQVADEALDKLDKGMNKLFTFLGKKK